ncbi:hypothetical protein APS56_02245 [Pseudalgibacter alginicilyticus]|uniref:SGNH hydrolase-type esterase domain-containing protein n=1 Tax=Pseudalgibacter alginicilyticus TaxID=1736674 RepID=A0A0P0D5V3_9FLAO|nr:hypothetical protein [Pseudalgibacter alginicilyticus]ALJ04047.1 hypothetical protein APS56_02245 [Pseudalgibacter alginicilyticus]
MKKLFIKFIIYGILILLALELLVRIFHLTKDYPTRYVDEYGVEKWLPNQEGFSVTGNRRQNFSAYHINEFGYNSYREFKPSEDKVEIALVGDSFIEGFHQHYYNSIGKKIENQLSDVEVYEYGYAGYDFADQLHLINKYKKHFDLIDHVVIGLKFENDLNRGAYKLLDERMKLETPLYKNLRKFKLLVYLQTIGVLDAPKEFISNILTKKVDKAPELSESEEAELQKIRYAKYIKNFESLITFYGFDKKRFLFLLDSKNTPNFFLDYLRINHFKYIDFSNTLEKSKRPTNLIYDMHWNNHGRNLIANLISNYILNEE